MQVSATSINQSMPLAYRNNYQNRSRNYNTQDIQQDSFVKSTQTSAVTSNNAKNVSFGQNYDLKELLALDKRIRNCYKYITKKIGPEVDILRASRSDKNPFSSNIEIKNKKVVYKYNGGVRDTIIIDSKIIFPYYHSHPSTDYNGYPLSDRTFSYVFYDKKNHYISSCCAPLKNNYTLKIFYEPVPSERNLKCEIARFLLDPKGKIVAGCTENHAQAMIKGDKQKIFFLTKNGSSFCLDDKNIILSSDRFEEILSKVLGFSYENCRL